MEYRSVINLTEEFSKDKTRLKCILQDLILAKIGELEGQLIYDKIGAQKARDLILDIFDSAVYQSVRLQASVMALSRQMRIYHDEKKAVPGEEERYDDFIRYYWSELRQMYADYPYRYENRDIDAWLMPKEMMIDDNC